MDKIRAKVGRDGLNLREKFMDQDKLRKYICHKQKASSLLKVHIPELTTAEINKLLESFQYKKDPNYIAYEEFMNNISEKKVLQ